MSVDDVAKYLERVGFPAEEIIELLPYDPEVRTAKVTGVLKQLDDGMILTVETDKERYYAYSHTEVAPESVVAIAFAQSPLAADTLKKYPDAVALIVVEADLGLEDDRPVILPEATPLGELLSDVIESTVLDVEITPNRGDLYSVYGLARELSGLWGERFNPPPAPRVEIHAADHGIKLEIEAKGDVTQYLGYVIEGIKIARSPFRLRWNLHALGARAVNNVVDVTNFSMFLTGQPMHAFDASRISSSVVRVRRAESKENFTAIDHREYELTSRCLLIADERGPLALAGVMGGVDSEVSDNTVKLFLESAEFTREAVRRSIEQTGLTSDSSKRFAAGVDGEMVRYGAMVFIDTLADLCPDLKVRGELVYGEPRDKGSVSVKLFKLDSYAAYRVDTEKAIENLELIGLDASVSEDTLSVKVPSHRNDVIEDVDVIEEVLRLSGYGDIPSNLSWHSIQPGKRSPLANRLNQIRELLSGWGLTETCSLSLISPESIPPGFTETVMKVTNPLSERLSFLRPSLLSSMLTVAAGNLRFGNTDLGLYEIGNVFIKEKKSHTEKTHLGILLSGNTTPLDWSIEQREVDYFDIKGMVEMFMTRFNIEEATFEADHREYFDQEFAVVKIGGKPVAELGRISAEVLESIDFNQDVLFCEINITALESVIGTESSFEGLPRFSLAERDMALLLDADHHAARVMQFVQKEAGQFCTSVEVFDSFSGDPLPKGKRNLGLRLRFQPRERTLTKDELDGIMVELAKKVSAEFGALVRGREGNGS